MNTRLNANLLLVFTVSVVLEFRSKLYPLFDCPVVFWNYITKTDCLSMAERIRVSFAY